MVSPPPSTRRRGSCCIRATSSSTWLRSTVGSPTCRGSAPLRPTTASACCCPTPPTPRSLGTRPASRPSAWPLMAAGENKWLRVGEGDLVIISANAIPGNEWAVAKVIDGLYRRGAEVVHSDQAEIHASGHGKQAELQTMLAVAKPEAFIPVHGEFRHLTHHARLAEGMGV